jgi:hypothetical protein
MTPIPAGVAAANLGLNGKQLDIALRGPLRTSIVRVDTVNGRKISPALLQIDVDHEAYTTFAALPLADRKAALGVSADLYARS